MSRLQRTDSLHWSETTTQQWSCSVIDFFLAGDICSHVQSRLITASCSPVGSHEMADTLNSCMIFMLALSSTSKWCKEEERALTVGLGRYFLLNHVGLSHLIYGLMLATSHHLLARPRPCPVSPLSIVSSCSRHQCIVLRPTETVFLFLMSSPRHILTASQGPAGTTTITSWRHSL